MDTSDLSSGGAFLHTDLLLEAGERFFMELMLPGRYHPIRAQGRVVRARASMEGPESGIAVELIDLEPEDRQALEQYRRTTIRRRGL